MRIILRQIRPALLAVVVFSSLVGVVYPLVMTAAAQAVFNDKADGSLLWSERDGERVLVGSRLLAQPFTSPEYFHPRPSAAGHDPAASSGSNLGPTSPDLLDAVAERVEQYRELNGLPADRLVPVDAVTASGSGLDPHISIANARLQTPRVAAARGLDVDDVAALVDDYTSARDFGVLGEPAVNVLELNVALDAIATAGTAG